MAASYGSISRKAYGSATTTSTSVPASTTAGNHLLYVQINANSGTAVTVGLPTGITRLQGYTPQTGTDGSFGWRLDIGEVTADGTTSYSTTHSSTNTETLMIRTTGSGTLSVDVFSQAARVGGATEAMTATSVTTTTADEVLYYICLNWNEVALTVPSGMTERQDSLFLYLASEARATAGSTGSRAVGGTTDAPWFANLIAIKDVSSGGINGTASITEGADTVSSTGTLAIKGNAGITEAADTVSATGKLALSGTAAITEGADTLSSTGKLAIVGSSSITEGADTVSATGTLIAAGTGTASITEGADTLSSTGTLAIKGTASIAEGADTVAATGKVALTGSASITEAADTLSATGTGASLTPITGTASIVEDPDILVATGAKIIPLVDTGGSGNQAGRAKRRRNINDDPDAFAELLEEWREKKRKKQAKDEEKQEVSQSEPDTIGPELYRQLLALEQAYERSMEAAEKLVSKRSIRAAMTAAQELEDAQRAYQAMLDDEDEEIIALFAA